MHWRMAEIIPEGALYVYEVSKLNYVCVVVVFLFFSLFWLCLKLKMLYCGNVKQIKLWILVSLLLFLIRTMSSLQRCLCFFFFPFKMQHWPFMLHSLVNHMVFVRQKCSNYPVAEGILLTCCTDSGVCCGKQAEPLRRRSQLEHGTQAASSYLWVFLWFLNLDLKFFFLFV